MQVNAFTNPSTTHHFSGRLQHQQYSMVHHLKHANNAIESINEDDAIIYTTAILNCAYDGTFFKGFTAGNSDSRDIKHEKKGNNTQSSTKRRQSRRSRTLQRKGGSYGYKSGRIRTVEDTIRSSLAKVYGDANGKQIKIEVCSRTDAGVHSESTVAQFYCIKDANSTESTAMRRPTSSNDTSNFLPLPFNSDLSKLVFVLNRMLPPDVRIMAAAPLPYVSSNTPFHPTLLTTGKTYQYCFAIGSVHDPITHQYTWHLDGSSNRAVGMNGKRFSIERALAAASLFVDSADDENMNVNPVKARDFAAFRAAFRGTDKGRVQSTMCKLWQCDILEERKELLPSWETDSFSDQEDGVDSNRRYGGRLNKQTTAEAKDDISPQTFTVVITGDRFLYKMVRNIVGTIVAVGCGHLELEDVSIALETGKWDRENRRICAPARGLTLTEVNYPPDIQFNWHNG